MAKNGISGRSCIFPATPAGITDKEPDAIADGDCETVCSTGEPINVWQIFTEYVSDKYLYFYFTILKDSKNKDMRSKEKKRKREKKK